MSGSNADIKKFAEVFSLLREMMREYESSLQVIDDKPGRYYVDGAYSKQFKKNLNFGAVITQKNYVSYYLMPVYMYPDLLDGISPELSKRMQGKSCFNFNKVDKNLMGELSKLTRKSFRRFKKEGGTLG